MKKIFLYITAILLCLIYGCDKSDKIILDETQGVDYQLGDLYVDEHGNEGIVCRIQGHSKNQKIVMIVSLDEGYESWGPLNQQVAPYDSLRSIYAISNFDGYGIAILRYAIGLGLEQFPALKWCNDKNHGEKYPTGSSWHLPTKEELECISVISSYDKSVDLYYKYYWTCVEDIKGSSDYGASNANYMPKDRAMPLNLSGDTFSNKDLWIKRNKYYVRAVKYLYYED